MWSIFYGCWCWGQHWWGGLHILLVSEWVLFGSPSFLPQSKDIHLGERWMTWMDVCLCMLVIRLANILSWVYPHPGSWDRLHHSLTLVRQKQQTTDEWTWWGCYLIWTYSFEQLPTGFPPNPEGNGSWAACLTGADWLLQTATSFAFSTLSQLGHGRRRRSSSHHCCSSTPTARIVRAMYDWRRLSRSANFSWLADVRASAQRRISWWTRRCDWQRNHSAENKGVN